ITCWAGLIFFGITDLDFLERITVQMIVGYFFSSKMESLKMYTWHTCQNSAIVFVKVTVVCRVTFNPIFLLRNNIYEAGVSPRTSKITLYVIQIFWWCRIK